MSFHRPIRIAIILTSICSITQTASFANCQIVEKHEKSATRLMAEGKYSKAVRAWHKAIVEADDCPQRFEAEGRLHRRLAESYMLMEDYPNCDEELKESEQCYKIAGQTNVEVADDREKLSKVYRSINLSEISNRVAAEVFKKAGIDTIGIMRLQGGNRIELFLSDKFKKTIERPPINKVMLEKRVSFDLFQTGDGEIHVNHIHGLLLRASMWIKIRKAVIKPNTNHGEPTARITAEKVGLYRTVSVPVPPTVIEPLQTLVQKIRDFSEGKTRPHLATGSIKPLGLFRLRRAKPPALMNSAELIEHSKSITESGEHTESKESATSEK